MSEESNYALSADQAPEIPVPDLDYGPPRPKKYAPKIGLIGCGGITEYHLKAYKADGLDVVALCDIHEEAARKRQTEFYPDADLYTDYHELLAHADIDVVDVALHPRPRVPAIEAALNAGKHVLSQKPFILDLDEGARLVALADEKNCKLAVNQNGRWAPYVRFMTLAIQEGLIGDVQSVTIGMNWDHTWIKGTAFEKIYHIILYDFAIHWVDMVRVFFGEQKALAAYATNASAREQTVASPLLASTAFTFEHGVGAITFDANSRHGAEEYFTVVGSKGTLKTRGASCANEEVKLFTDEGWCAPTLKGHWFDEGFRGTMGELLCAIEEDRDPFNSGRSNLKSLELAFAAIESADTGTVVIPGMARRLGKTCEVAE